MDEIVKKMKILDLMLGTARNRTRAFAAGAQHHNHHATLHYCVQNYCYFLYTYTAWECCKVWAPKFAKDGGENQRRTRWDQSGRHNENGMECGKCKFWDKVLWWGEKFPRLLHQEGTEEFKLPESCCHSSYRYLHQRLLSIVPWFSESRHLFLARSKINHILASLDPLEKLRGEGVAFLNI